MNSRVKPPPKWAPYGLQRRFDLPGGYEYVNFPSILARRVLYYALSLGETKWKKGARHYHPNSSCPFHDDRGFLFHFVLSGRLTHRTTGQMFIASRNEAVLLDLRGPVEYFNAGTKPVKLLWVWFDGMGLSEILAELHPVEEPVFCGLDRKQAVRLFRELVLTVDRAQPGYEVKLSALLGALLAELCRVRPPPSLLNRDSSTVALSPAVHKVVTAIARKYARRWTIKELSQISGLSMYYFFRIFRRETGYSPTQYMNRYRVEQAKMLLTATKMTVQEIARQVGIPNRKHFADVFRQLTNVSAREYRARGHLKSRGGRRKFD